MTGRSRHGLHVVGDDVAPAEELLAPFAPPPRRRPVLGLDQQSVVLSVRGGLDADTAGRLRMFLAMFTVVGGPRELVLDLSEVIAIDDDGMAPIFEARLAMTLRQGSLRVSSVSSEVARYLDRIRCSRTLVTGSPSVGARWGPAVGSPGAADDGGQHSRGDGHDR